MIVQVGKHYVKQFAGSVWHWFLAPAVLEAHRLGMIVDMVCDMVANLVVGMINMIVDMYMVVSLVVGMINMMVNMCLATHRSFGELAGTATSFGTEMPCGRYPAVKYLGWILAVAECKYCQSRAADAAFYIGGGLSNGSRTYPNKIWD